MTQVVTEDAVEVRPVVDGVHLVDADGVEVGCMGLDGIEQGHRLAVRQRHDQVGPGTDVLEDCAGPAGGCHGRPLRHRSSPATMARRSVAVRRPVDR